MARFIAAAAAATLLVLFAAAATSAQPITVTVAQPPAWTRNKTEWRSRLYNSLRLTPAQVGALETVLDARDALRAPLKNASWTLARAAATAERAKPRNATLEQALVKPLLSLENSTVVAVTRAKENALNATEIKLRAAATAVAMLRVPVPPPSHLQAKSSTVDSDDARERLGEGGKRGGLHHHGGRSKLGRRQLALHGAQHRRRDQGLDGREEGDSDGGAHHCWACGSHEIEEAIGKSNFDRWDLVFI